MRITKGTGIDRPVARSVASAASNSSAFSLSKSTIARLIETTLSGS